MEARTVSLTTSILRSASTSYVVPRTYCRVHGADGEKLPTAITGDFDSLRPSVRVWYESRGVPLVHDPSQDSTDFGKSMNIVRSHDPESSYIGDKEVPHPKMTVLAMGGIGGRVDQSFHSVWTLDAAATKSKY